MPDSEILFKSATELASLIKARKVSPVEVVRAHLDHIEAFNPKVNAFITVTAEHALDQARRAESEIAKGQYRGPLHGIPYAPKDMLATKASARRTAQSDGRLDSGLRVHRHRAPQPGRRDPDRQTESARICHGQWTEGAHRPRSQSLGFLSQPSGSSSGLGASLAAGMVPLVIGSDSGGSIRGPARKAAELWGLSRRMAESAVTGSRL